MSDQTVMLTINGVEGEPVQIWYRGAQDAPGDDPAPIVYTGIVGKHGTLTVIVPRAYLVLGRPTRRGGVPLALHQETAPAWSVRMPSE